MTMPECNAICFGLMGGGFVFGVIALAGTSYWMYRALCNAAMKMENSISPRTREQMAEQYLCEVPVYVGKMPPPPSLPMATNKVHPVTTSPN